MIRIISSLMSDESGVTAIEYGLIATGIAVAIIAAVSHKDEIFSYYDD